MTRREKEQLTLLSTILIENNQVDKLRAGFNGRDKMKKLLLIGGTFILIASAIYAQLPTTGYIGLYTDDSHSAWCVDPPLYGAVEFWIWCLPSDHGQMCAEFKIEYPSNVIASTVTSNDPIISVAMGDISSGMSVCYVECQWNWHWNFHQTLYVTTADSSIVEIVEHPGVDPPAYQFANCDTFPVEFPLEPCIRHTKFFINYDPNAEPPLPECAYAGTRSTTWGAIKSLYNKD